MARKKKDEKAEIISEKEKETFYEKHGVHPAALKGGEAFELFAAVTEKEINAHSDPRGYLKFLKSLYPSLTLILVKAGSEARAKQPGVWGHVYRRVDKSLLFAHTTYCQLDQEKGGQK